VIENLKLEELKDELYSKFGFYYAFIDDNLNLHLENDLLYKYLSYSGNDKKIHVNELFPELIDLNEEITKVINGELSEFVLKAINREDVNPICFNLYFFQHHYENFKCILTIKNVSEEINSLRMAQQTRNEIFLLQNQLIEMNNSLLVTNADSEKLNRELEFKVKERTEELELSVKRARKLFFQTVDALTQTLEIKDLYTAGHQYRVSALAGAIAKKMNLGDSVVEGIQIAGKLHDIGKIYVPIEFLTKPGSLLNEEFEVIKIHSVMGFEIIKNIEFPWPIASIVLQHHEKLDGSGYPFNLEGDAILIESRIITVADVVEAMSTNRPYRISPGLDKALEEIEAYKTIKYDTNVVDTCVELFKSGEFNWPETHDRNYKSRKIF
jgi:putative nucleotidyltransferase with HDIG domain